MKYESSSFSADFVEIDKIERYLEFLKITELILLVLLHWHQQIRNESIRTLAVLLHNIIDICIPNIEFYGIIIKTTNIHRDDYLFLN